MRTVVLVQPGEGIYGKVFKPWVPLSLLCAAAKVDRAGYRVKIVDQRVGEDWRRELERALDEDPVCVGITAMTGSQIVGALAAARIAKNRVRIPVVWGGVHATLFPGQTLGSRLVDIVVKGEGEETFFQLVTRLELGASLDDLPGICFRRDGEIVEYPDREFVNLDEYPPVPYHLVDLRRYRHRYFGEDNVVEMESSRGCPYDCTFCYGPLYNKKTWRPRGAAQVVASMRGLAESHGVRVFHFVDDGFFIGRERFREIMQAILAAGLRVRMGFQGVRIDTFDRLSDENIALLVQAGGRYLQFGVESGSPRILRMANKRLEVEQVLSLNRRLAEYPEIIPHYNFMCGFPEETREELFQTTSLAWRLLKENRNAMISPFHHYKPYPGTELAKTALGPGYQPPRTLEEWGAFDWTELTRQGLDRGTRRLFKNVEMVSVFADRKLENQSDSALWTLLAKIYRPVARLRLRNNFFSCMPEGRLMAVVSGVRTLPSRRSARCA